jgi:hypothetical protein
VTHKKGSSRVVALVALSTCTHAFGQDTAKTPELAPPLGHTPPAQVRALEVLAKNFSFRSRIPANTFWTGAPEIPGSGVFNCQWILGGVWLSCSVEAHYGPAKDGKGPLKNGQIWTWTSQNLVGWDVQQKTYRWLAVDNESATYDFSGRIEGSKLIFESPGYQLSQGVPQKFRFIYDFADPDAIKFDSDNQVKGDATWRPSDMSIYTPIK